MTIINISGESNVVAIRPGGPRGLDGDKGWSALYAMETDGARRILKLVDWINGQGGKPAVGTYMGPTGPVADKEDAVDVRGATGPIPNHQWSGTSLRFQTTDGYGDWMNIQGDPGIDGDPGEAASVEIGTITTLPAGSEATVDNVGTTTNAIINFGIPRGDPGEDGDDGEDGDGDVNAPDAAVVVDEILAAAQSDGKKLKGTGKKTTDFATVMQGAKADSAVQPAALAAALASKLETSEVATSGANKVLRLDGSGRLPALDGSLLASLPYRPPTGYIRGLQLSRPSVGQITVSPGQCRDSSDADTIALASAVTKTMSAWAVGSGNGGMASGSSSTTGNTLHVWLIKRPDTGVVDVLLSNTLSPTMPSGYTLRRRVGSVVAPIPDMMHIGDRLILGSPPQDVSVSDPGASALTYALSVPTGIVVEAILHVIIVGGASQTAYALISPLAVADVAPTSTLRNVERFPNNNTPDPAYLTIPTDTSGQIRARLNTSASGTALRIQTLGWLDRREP